jgi:hypothetical protein
MRRGRPRNDIFPVDPGEHLSDEGAIALAWRIEKYHADRGAVVHTRIVPVKIERCHNIN